MRALVIIMLSVFCIDSFAADWPQWRGDGRRGVSDETGLLKKWPDGGPKLLWFAEGIGEGNSSMSIADGTIYVTGNKGKGKNEVEYLSAFDLKGKLKWQEPYGKPWVRSYSPARTTATIENGNAYVINGTGAMSCFDIKDGNEKWTVDVSEKYDGQYGPWGIAESPLVVDDKVICTPGGKKATMVALDKMTGKVIWASKSIDDKPAYCSPIVVERGGKKIIITIIAKHILGVNAADGEILWTYDCANYQPKQKGINTATPLYYDGGIYVTSGYDMGSIKLKLAADGMSVEKEWVNMDLDTHVGGVVLVDGYIYGASWHNNGMGNWICVDWETGKTMYDTEWHNKGQVIAADGMLYCYDENKKEGGNMGLVKSGSKAFDVVSEFKIDKGEGIHWAHPAISDGVLYVRHGEVLMAYDIKR